MGVLVFCALVNVQTTTIVGLALLLAPITCFKIYYVVIALRDWYRERRQRELSDVTISDIVNDSSLKDVAEYEKQDDNKEDTKIAVKPVDLFLKEQALNMSAGGRSRMFS